MAGPLVIGAEGVLLVPNKSYAASPPVTEGVELALMLNQFPTTRMTVVCGTTDEASAWNFIKLNRIGNVDLATIAPEDKDSLPEEAQWNVIEKLRGRGPINLVVTSFRYVFLNCTASHQPVLLFGRRGAVGELPPTAAWEDLTARTRRHREAEADAPNR